MAKPEDKKKELGVIASLDAGEALKEQAGVAMAALGNKKPKMTFEQVQKLSTSQLLDIMHRDTGVNERIEENDFWKVILERKPFWFFDLTRTELGEYNNLHLEHHERMEREMNAKIEFLEIVVRLLIEMVADNKIEMNISTALELAGFGGLCPNA